MATSKTARTLYKAYEFKDHDPVLDRMRTIMDDSGLSYGKAAEMSGVSSTTFANWDKNKTKRPQFATIMAAARAFGYDVQIVQVAGDRHASGGVKFARRRGAERPAPSSPAATH